MIVSRAPRRILFVDHIAVLGGGELALLALIRALDRTRFEPVVLLFSDGPLAGELRPIAETHVLPMPQDLLDARRESLGGSRLPWRKGLGLVRFLSQLSAAITRLRPHVIHTNSLKADLLAGLAARYADVPLVWHIRDRIDEDYLPAMAVRFFRGACRTLPNALVANSRATLASLRLPPGKPAVVVSSGIDLRPFVQAAEHAETLPEAIAAGHEIAIGLIGRICPWKGQEVFLRAGALLAETHPAARFYVVGAPLFGEIDFERSMHALAAELGIADRVVFTGFERDIPGRIAKLHLVVHASTIPEPFGQVIVQGMAAGRPVVASEGGGPSEIIANGVTGWLVPRGDPRALANTIRGLLATPQQAQTVARSGQKEVLAHYGSDQTTPLVEALYDQLLPD